MNELKDGQIKVSIFPGEEPFRSYPTYNPEKIMPIEENKLFPCERHNYKWAINIMHAYIIFIDIRGFTKFVNILYKLFNEIPHDKEEERLKILYNILIQFITQFRRTICKRINPDDGFIEKFIGDGVLVILPEGKESINVYSIAEQISTDFKDSLKSFQITNCDIPETYKDKINKIHIFKEIDVGIGISYGHIGRGIITVEHGGKFLKDETSISPYVNLASRLCSLANRKVYNVFCPKILMSVGARDKLINGGHYKKNFFSDKEVAIPGYEENITVYFKKKGR